MREFFFLFLAGIPRLLSSILLSLLVGLSEYSVPTLHNNIDSLHNNLSPSHTSSDREKPGDSHHHPFPPSFTLKTASLNCRPLINRVIVKFSLQIFLTEKLIRSKLGILLFFVQSEAVLDVRLYFLDQFLKRLKVGLWSKEPDNNR